ncbi:hypothetical protein MASR2M78_01280 [Treponema sp.]
MTSLFIVVLRSLDLGSNPFIRLNRGGLREGLLFAWGILTSFAGGSLLFATTTSTELREGIAAVQDTLRRPLLSFLARLSRGKGLRARLAKHLAHTLAAFDVSLLIALTLSFIPRVFEVWEAAEDAHLARCGKKGLGGTVSILPLVAERLIEAASETAAALEMRGALLKSETLGEHGLEAEGSE